MYCKIRPVTPLGVRQGSSLSTNYPPPLLPVLIGFLFRLVNSTSVRFRLLRGLA